MNLAKLASLLLKVFVLILLAKIFLDFLLVGDQTADLILWKIFSRSALLDVCGDTADYTMVNLIENPAQLIY